MSPSELKQSLEDALNESHELMKADVAKALQ